MNERELMKLAESMEEFSMSDFTVEELRSMSESSSAEQNSSYDRYKQKYFEYYDDVKDKTLKRQDW